MQTTQTFKRNGVEPGSGSNHSSAEEGGSARRDVSSLNIAKSLFIFAAGMSFLFSVYLWFMVDKNQGVFVGLWVPSILSLGGLLLAGKDESR